MAQNLQRRLRPIPSAQTPTVASRPGRIHIKLYAQTIYVAPPAAALLLVCACVCVCGVVSVLCCRRCGVGTHTNTLIDIILLFDASRKPTVAAGVANPGTDHVYESVIATPESRHCHTDTAQRITTTATVRTPPLSLNMHNAHVSLY